MWTPCKLLNFLMRAVRQGGLNHERERESRPVGGASHVGVGRFMAAEHISPYRIPICAQRKRGAAPWGGASDGGVGRFMVAAYIRTCLSAGR